MQWTVRLEAMTSAGELKATELVTFSRAAMVGTLAEVGLVLAEAKSLLAKLQASMLCGQVAEHAAHRRACPGCGVLQPLKDQSTRRLQTLFGTVEVEAPQFKLCRCRQPAPMAKAVTFSPVCALLTARCTPELERVQAELGACTSRSGTRHVSWTPYCRPRLQGMRACATAPMPSLCGSRRPTGKQQRRSRLSETSRTRPHRRMNTGPPSCSTAPTSVPCPAIRFGTSRRSAARSSEKGSPPDALPWCAAWPSSRTHCCARRCKTRAGREGDAVTAISDGDPALPALVRSATGGPVEHILDWFHLPMRVHHVEQVMRGLCVVEPPLLAPLGHAQADVERLRHLLWNGYHEKACEALGRIMSWIKTAIVLNDPATETRAKRLVARCTELRTYIETNEGALIDYGERYRAGKPISTSRAEGTVNQLVNARMNKRRQMRWSPQGAHRVLQVRAAVLDGRLGHQAIQLAA